MSKVKLMDCTLRDGGNVMGKGFDAEITDMVLDGLTACGVPIIEFGNAGGIGAYEVAGFTQALTDQEYLDIGKKYLGRGSELGMFLNARRYREKNVDIAKENGLSFLRIGADARGRGHRPHPDCRYQKEGNEGVLLLDESLYPVAAGTGRGGEEAGSCRA